MTNRRLPATFDEPPIQRPQTQTRHVWIESCRRLRRYDEYRRYAESRLAQYTDTGASGRRDGIRGYYSSRPLARLWRSEQFSRSELRNLFLGRRNRRLDEIFVRVLDVARGHDSS